MAIDYGLIVCVDAKERQSTKNVCHTAISVSPPLVVGQLDEGEAQVKNTLKLAVVMKSIQIA